MIVHGVTRSVILTRRWALKLPWGLAHAPVRGWLANRSEWRQRHRRRVCRPVLTLLHFVLVMPRADEVGRGDERGFPVDPGPWDGCHGEKCKPSSWGRFGNRWLMIDYEMSWRVDRGIVGSLYFGWQEWRYGGADLIPWMRRFLVRSTRDAETA